MMREYQMKKIVNLIDSFYKIAQSYCERNPKGLQLPSMSKYDIALIPEIDLIGKKLEDIDGGDLIRRYLIEKLYIELNQEYNRNECNMTSDEQEYFIKEKFQEIIKPYMKIIERNKTKF